MAAGMLARLRARSASVVAALSLLTLLWPAAAEAGATTTTPTALPTVAATATATAVPTVVTPTSTAIATPTFTSTPPATPTSSAAASPTTTVTPGSPTARPTLSPVATNTAAPSATAGPTGTAGPAFTSTPTSTPSATPTASLTPALAGQLAGAAMRAASFGISLGSVPTTGLSVSGGAPGAFPAAVAGRDQSVQGSLGAWVVGDFRSQPDGWTVSVQATRLQCTPRHDHCPAEGDILPAGSVGLAPPAIVTLIGGAAAPVVVLSQPAAIDGTAPLKVASASAAVGRGLWLFLPGQVGAGQLELTVPSSVYAATYTTTLTISVAAGP